MISDRPRQSVHPPGTAPECRARHLSIMLTMIDDLPLPDRSAIGSSISDKARAAVRGGTGLSWVSMRHNVEIVEAISRRLGPARARAFFATFQQRAFKSAMMRNFVEGALRLAGREPATALRLIPAGYDLVFRNVGAWDPPQLYDECGVMVLRRIPALCLNGSVWLESLAAALHSILTIQERVGSVELTSVDPERAKAELRFFWQDSSSASQEDP